MKRAAEGRLSYALRRPVLHTTVFQGARDMLQLPISIDRNPAGVARFNGSLIRRRCPLPQSHP